MTLLDDYLALPNFGKEIIGAAPTDAVAVDPASAQVLTKHAELTGSMNVDLASDPAALDALIALAEAANQGEGVKLCVNAGAYPFSNDADAHDWGASELQTITDIKRQATALAAKVDASSVIVDYDESDRENPHLVVPIMGSLEVGWVMVDCRAYRETKTGIDLPPAAQREWLRSIAIKLDLVGAILKAEFPSARLVFWRNGETSATHREGEPVLANYAAYAEARMVEWFGLHSRVDTLTRFNIAKQKLHLNTPGADWWGAGVSIGGGRDRTGTFTFAYNEGRDPWYHLGRYFAFDDSMKFLYEWPGPFDQRVGNAAYMTAMRSLNNGFFDQE